MKNSLFSFTHHSIARFRERWAPHLSHNEALHALIVASASARKLREKTHNGQDMWQCEEPRMVFITKPCEWDKRDTVCVTVLPEATDQREQAIDEARDAAESSRRLAEFLKPVDPEPELVPEPAVFEEVSRQDELDLLRQDVVALRAEVSKLVASTKVRKQVLMDQHDELRDVKRRFREAMVSAELPNGVLAYHCDQLEMRLAACLRIATREESVEEIRKHIAKVCEDKPRLQVSSPEGSAA